jgi:hypothetical protein
MRIVVIAHTRMAAKNFVEKKEMLCAHVGPEASLLYTTRLNMGLIRLTRVLFGEGPGFST